MTLAPKVLFVAVIGAIVLVSMFPREMLAFRKKALGALIRTHMQDNDLK